MQNNNRFLMKMCRIPTQNNKKPNKDTSHKQNLTNNQYPHHPLIETVRRNHNIMYQLVHPQKIRNSHHNFSNRSCKSKSKINYKKIRAIIQIKSHKFNKKQEDKHNLIGKI